KCSTKDETGLQMTTFALLSTRCGSCKECTLQSGSPEWSMTDRPRQKEENRAAAHQEPERFVDADMRDHGCDTLQVFCLAFEPHPLSPATSPIPPS
ncbi:hypothetical protein BaRGS_00012023, partial [Batillaria attramentaria]